SVIAIEPVADLQKVARERCAAARLDNVEVVGATAFDLGAHVPAGSIDSAFLIQSLHHFHRRPEVFAELGRVVRPGGRLYLVEPHHNLRRVGRLARKYRDRKSTRLNSSHVAISYAVFCLKKKK